MKGEFLPDIHSIWRCEHCSASGPLLELKNDNIFSVFYRTAEAHKSISPNCSAMYFQVIVQNPLNCPSEAKWRKFIQQGKFTRKTT